MSPKKIVVLGAGNFARETMDVLKAINDQQHQFDVLGYLDDNPEKQGKLLNGWPILGGIDWLGQGKKQEVFSVCGIGEPHIRRKVIEKALSFNAKFCNVIHPNALMTEFVEMGEGIVITAGCILTCNIKIGNHVHLNLATTVGHDVVMGDFATTAPGVHISGNVNIGEGTYFGTGAVTVEKLTIGEWTIIGAGAVVANHLPANVTAVGVPARAIKVREAGWQLV